MSKITLLPTFSLALLLCLPLGCEKDDDDGGGDDANDSAMTSNDDGDDGEATAADDFGDDTGGGSGPSTTSTTSTSSTTTTDGGDGNDGNDGSAACESFFDCPTVVCECPDGNVEIASCLDGMCATADDCADPPHNACEG